MKLIMINKENSMLEILQFIFQDIWHFIGTCILLEIITDGLKGFIINIINKNN